MNVLQYFRYKLAPMIIIVIGCLMSCNKLVSVPPPVASITTSQVFADSADASAAVLGIYQNMINTGGGLGYGDGFISIYCGQSADELIDFFANPSYLNLNFLNASVGTTDVCWQSPYQYMYQVNSCIESLNASTGLSQRAKNQLLGEVKFFRAFFYFYLVNLYGDVPLALTSNYKQNIILPRSPKADVYMQIVEDLTDAQGLLPDDYSASGGERTRINKAAVTAMLARVNLYLGDWASAFAAASTVIGDPLFALEPDPNRVFLANSGEAILQWQLSPTLSPYNCTSEGYQVVPSENTNPPNFYVNAQLLGAFEPGDTRKAAWIDSTFYSGTTYYYPYKYKNGPAQSDPTAPLTEYYMVLRLAEQYLIRAEAAANGAGGGMSAAIDDLNTIRARAGLPALSSTLTQPEVLAAVAQERRIELFAEWGHRWLDLKRTGQIDAVMTIATPLKGGGTTWESFQQWYPIPLSDISRDPNLKQNPQY